MPSDNGPIPATGAPEPRGNGVSASIRRRGTRLEGMVSTRELSHTRREKQQAEDAARLEPKGNVAGPGVPPSPGMGRKRHRRPERTYPHPALPANHGKPAPFPLRGRSAARPTEAKAGK